MVKTIGNILIAILFLLTIPVFSISLSLRFSHFSAAYIKQTFDNQDIYTKLHAMLSDIIDQNLQSNITDNPLSLISPFIKREITPLYLQKKTHQIIDDSTGWIEGKTKAPPLLSFSDLKEKLIKQNPQIISQLASSEKMYNEFKLQTEETAKQTDIQDSSPQTFSLPDFHFSSFLEKEPVIQLSTYLGWIKYVYILILYGPIVVGIFLVIDVFLILLLSNTTVSRLRSLTILFFLSAIENYGLFLVANQFLPSITKYLPLPSQIYSVASLLLSIVTNPFILSFSRILPFTSLFFVFLGLLCLDTSILIQKHSFPKVVIAAFVFIISTFTGIAGYQVCTKFPKIFFAKPMTYSIVQPINTQLPLSPTNVIPTITKIQVKPKPMIKSTQSMKPTDILLPDYPQEEYMEPTYESIPDIPIEEGE